MLNLFYQNPDPDRWVPWDRYPRKWIRNLVRQKRSLSGQEMVFFNLEKGLQKAGIRYRVNDFRHAKAHPGELVGIVGKSQLVDQVEWKNPILFGAAIMSHPCEDPGLLQRRPIRKILVPGEWMRKMCEPFWGEHVEVWPVGIDTERWTPQESEKSHDFLIYDKVRWEHERYEKELIEPIRTELKQRGLSFQEIRYGFYREEEFSRKLGASRAMIFLCEHETQGLAYQQALSSGVPILAWDRGGFWQDPSYYPHKVKFRPVSSVPYWDDRCGMRFEVVDEFPQSLTEFSEKLEHGGFQPRSYILENLTLEKCAEEYQKKYLQVQAG